MPGSLDSDLLMRLVMTIPLFLFSLTVHEYAHAWTARRCGDHTAEDAGRLTLDPRAHIDPAGALMFLLASFAGVGFGWAKPVPVRRGNCARPLQAMLWVSAAGPLSNLLQALVGLVLLVALGFLGAQASLGVLSGVAAVFEQPGLSTLDIIVCLLGTYLQINLALMLFNLIPIPPLDGGRILVSVLPYRLAAAVASLESYGFVMLLVLFRPLGSVLGVVLGQAAFTIYLLLQVLGIR